MQTFKFNSTMEETLVARFSVKTLTAFMKFGMSQSSLLIAVSQIQKLTTHIPVALRALKLHSPHEFT